MKDELEKINLNWNEKELPQKERTKHVHGLHPYLGKFIPQLPKIFLDLYFKRGGTILDPFMGSGTTLIEANILGMNSIGIDISDFNCKMVRVKSCKYNLLQLKYEINHALKIFTGIIEGQISIFNEQIPENIRNLKPEDFKTENEYLNKWFSDNSIKHLLCYKAVIDSYDYEYKEVLEIILSRAARSARQVPHYELDWAREPVKEPYYCHKHKRTCYPTDGAIRFLSRYSGDTFKRLKEFSNLRSDTLINVIHGDSREVNLSQKVDGIFTSPPYCGLIDYHEQHKYAYELLGLKDYKENEIGKKENGKNLKAKNDYKENIAKVFYNCRNFIKNNGKVIIVINDSLGLYPEIIEKSGLIEEDRITRKVDRRTGRRAGGFEEDIIICKVINH